MFSMEKCTGGGHGGSEECELFAGGGEAMGADAGSEVASAVAAVSDEIGDILKDELGDADRADLIGAELAGLSTELGILAGLADGEAPSDFASRFEVPFEWIAMSGAVGSGSGSSSSSSWSGHRGARRRPARPPRSSRKRPIAKGKEISRRRSIAARRAASLRLRRAEVQSDASDVGADTDSDDWTELDDESNMSDSSSGKEGASGDADCNGFQQKGAMEAPPMGQFLLPLFSAEPTGSEPEHFLIRHEDILQLLASAEESAREEMLAEDDGADQAEALSSSDAYCDEEPPVTPEEEAALLHYVCESDRVTSTDKFEPIEEWLLGVYHSWCEISALMYTLIGTNMSVEMISQDWVYRARFGCHCRACVGAAAAPRALSRLLRRLVAGLTHAGADTLPIAMCIMRALKLGAIAAEGASGDPALGHEGGAQIPSDRWELHRLRRTSVSGEGAAIIHEELSKLAAESDIAHMIVHQICLCRTYDMPFEKEYAFERLCKILENFKLASTITFKVDMIPAGPSCSRPRLAACAARLARWLQQHRRLHTARRLPGVRAAPPTRSAWAGYKHRCDCLTPRTLCAEQRKQLLRISFFGMMQAVNEFNGSKPGTNADAEKPPNEIEPEQTRELQQGAGTGAKPPDSPQNEPTNTTTQANDQHSIDQETNDQGANDQVAEDQEMNDQETVDLDQESNAQCLEAEEGEASGGEMDDCSWTDSDGNSGSLGLSSCSSLDSASELLLSAADQGEDTAPPTDLCRTVRHLMKSIASIERLMDRVLKHCDELPANNRSDETRSVGGGGPESR